MALNWFYILAALAVAAGGLRVAWKLATEVLGAESGSAKMQEIARAIREGAEAFLKTQYRTIGILSIVCAALLGWFYYAYLEDPHWWTVPLSFLLGAACSAAAGVLGMWVSVRANLKTAHAATRSLNDALRLALRGGAVSGIAVVGLSLLGVGGLFIAFGGMSDPGDTVLKIVGFAFGASFVALFAQLGGGIYTKAADVGADLVGKVEKGIPEDDPRNPAVIADLVGDNVGDCAGRGADLFESTAAENIGAMILGVSLAAAAIAAGMPFTMGAIGLVLFPLVARALGLIGSIVGIYVVRTEEDGDPMAALNRGFYTATALSLGGFFLACLLLLRNAAHPNAPYWFFAAGVVGILNAVAFLLITQYYTEYRYRPVKVIAEASRTGPATNIISGLAVALECTALPAISISVSLILAYWCGEKALPGIAGAGLFGTAIATMGMLAPAAFILAMDTFGPISDNAGGIVEMSQAPEEVRRKMDRLDAVGNTTKALTKGYAIGSAALAAFLLFRAYLDEVHKFTGADISVDLTRVPTFVGGLLGATLVFLFSALAIRAVGKAAYTVIEEVRRQFRADPGIMAGTSRPDYGRCVDIVTRGALKQMILPGLLAVLTPVAVGVIFKRITIGGGGSMYPGAEAVAAVLMVGTIAGILLATVMNNGGGAWDNAKKYIETGAHGGKGSETHKAAVVGDTVGDPLKDTAGPSLHVLIKLLATVTLVLAPLFI